jgi:hypothetical protein
VINASLTASRYHLLMQENRPSDTHSRTGQKAAIWLAFAVAIGIHTIILLLPLAKQPTVLKETKNRVEVQLVSTIPQATPVQEVIPTPPLPEPITEIPEPRVEQQTVAEAVKTQAQVPVTKPAPVLPGKTSDVAELNDTERSRLAHTILARQFVTEEPVIDQIFGKPVVQDNDGLQMEYHPPVRQSLISMLDNPMPELPFAYQEGLVHFAYDPGVKGDLQRFWDVITPEFGWRTDNGTEVRCILILIIAGCAWK